MEQDITLDHFMDGTHRDPVVPLLKAIPHVTYCIAGLETAPTTGARHLQGYIEFDTRVKLSTLKKTFSNDRNGGVMLTWNKWIETWHFEVAKGTAVQNQAYCRKSHTMAPNRRVYEEGEPMEDKHQGKRVDFDAAKELLRSGQLRTVQDVRDVTGMSVAVSREMERWVAERNPNIVYVKHVFYLYGTTGAGKSLAAHTAATLFKREFPRWDYYKMGASSKWFNGYVGQELAIIDDIRPQDWDFNHLLRCLDWDTYCVEIKGGHTFWFPKIVIITSPVSVEDAWGHRLAGEEGSIAQLQRRINGRDDMLGGCFHLSYDDESERIRFEEVFKETLGHLKRLESIPHGDDGLPRLDPPGGVSPIHRPMPVHGSVSVQRTGATRSGEHDGTSGGTGGEGVLAATGYGFRCPPSPGRARPHSSEEEEEPFACNSLDVTTLIDNDVTPAQQEAQDILDALAFLDNWDAVAEI
nr:MAG: replication polyprotein [Chemarfal virus 47]